MKWLRRGEGAAPPWALERLDLRPRDRVLAWGQDAVTGSCIVASLHALHHVPSVPSEGRHPEAEHESLAVLPTGVAADASALWSRPWLEVLAGAWEPRTRTLSVTWVDDELWHAVRARQKDLSETPGALARRPKRLLSGLMKCGVCGSGMTLNGGKFACSGHRERGTCHNSKIIAATTHRPCGER